MNSPRWSEENIVKERQRLKEILSGITRWEQFENTLGPEYIVAPVRMIPGEVEMKDTSFVKPTGSSCYDCRLSTRKIESDLWRMRSYQYKYTGREDCFHYFNVYNDYKHVNERDNSLGVTSLESIHEGATIKPGVLECVIVNVFDYEPGKERQSMVEQAMESRKVFFDHKSHPLN
jgi:hypothetical protein